MPANIYKSITASRNLCLLATIALLVTACGSAPPVPVDQFYRLETGSHEGGKLFNDIAVRRFATDSLRNDRAILYGNIKQQHTLNQYHYHHWTDAPSRMLQQHLIDFIHKNGLAKTVVSHEPGMKSDNIIYGKIGRFEQQFSGSRSHAIVEITLGLRKDNKHMPAFVRVYKQHIPAASNNMHDVAAAFSTAVNRIFSDFISDVAQDGTTRAQP